MKGRYLFFATSNRGAKTPETVVVSGVSGDVTKLVANHGCGSRIWLAGMCSRADRRPVAVSEFLRSLFAAQNFVRVDTKHLRRTMFAQTQGSAQPLRSLASAAGGASLRPAATPFCSLHLPLAALANAPLRLFALRAHNPDRMSTDAAPETQKKNNYLAVVVLFSGL